MKIYENILYLILIKTALCKNIYNFLTSYLMAMKKNNKDEDHGTKTKLTIVGGIHPNNQREENHRNGNNFALTNKLDRKKEIHHCNSSGNHNNAVFYNDKVKTDAMTLNIIMDINICAFDKYCNIN